MIKSVDNIRNACYNIIRNKERVAKSYKVKKMIKFTEMNEGEKVTEKTFETFEALKKHLLENDYFGWINDNEPEKELPNIQEVEMLEELQAIFEEYDYSWWTLVAEEI